MCVYGKHISTKARLAETGRHALVGSLVDMGQVGERGVEGRLR